MKSCVAILTVVGLLLAFQANTALGKEKENSKKTPPGLEKKGGVPPGLQKKGGVPPGQAKKRGQPSQRHSQEEIEGDVQQVESAPGTPPPPPPGDPVTKTPAPAPKTPAPVTKDAPATRSSGGNQTVTTSEVARESSPSKPVAPPEGNVSPQQQRLRDKLNGNLSELSVLTKDPEVREVMVRRIAAYHQIPPNKLEADLAAFPGLGLGDVYAANVVARKARKPVETIVAEHREGRSWGRLMNEYRVDMAKMVELSLGFKSGAQNTARRLARNN